jgi:hypothetical protein
MCVACHLAPGLATSELSVGLYPAPPDLSRETVDPAEAFWIIKHGIKATGMPAWGKSMADEYIWNLTAFVVKLPDLDQTQYRTLVAESSGHSHGESAHPPSESDASAATSAPPEPPRGITHRHADGTVETHRPDDH